MKRLTLIQYTILPIAFSACLITACHSTPQQNAEVAPLSDLSRPVQTNTEMSHKANVYQIFTRLFGNKTENNIPWGTIEENGVGKFADIDDAALQGIKELGISHIWYTGVLHHAVIADYSQYGISNDDPDVVKGRAGSPYAIKDYYNVNPDLAVNPANRLAEFEALIDRTHAHGMKVIIDIVPNHVARNYQSTYQSEQVEGFGVSDNTDVEYAPNNNFYYIVGQAFQVPKPQGDYRPLGGRPYPGSDGHFDENPAKWTGNGSRQAQPDFNDWYETVKINYGVRPDGSVDFPRLPDNAAQLTAQQHFQFWQNQDVPNSWLKFRNIVEYWLDKGVDGFRYDMAEMVPVEFWSYLNSAIKAKKPDAFLLAEVYNPALYREYIFKGKMDYLYDKVEMYDTLKLIIQGKASTDAIVPIQARMRDIEQHMLHFLENHDEQRIASPEFAGNANFAKPAMVVSATLSSAPTLVYFAQEVGERAEHDAGFGKASRTTIFDYWGVPAHQRWMNNGAFDGARLTEDEQQLRQFYQELLQFTRQSSALMGNYADLHQHNRAVNPSYSESVFSFVRWSDDEQLIIVSNFDRNSTVTFDLNLPAAIITNWQTAVGDTLVTDQLSDHSAILTVNAEGAKLRNVTLPALTSRIYRLPSGQKAEPTVDDTLP